MARKFLIIVAVLIALFVAGRLALQFYPDQLSRLAFVPTGQFEPQPAFAQGRYADKALWFARPGVANDPAHFAPAGMEPQAPVRAAVFFVHPTSYLARGHWNAPLHDPEADKRTAIFLSGMASPFREAEALWAPRYRQATFGAFLTDKPEGKQALDAAYGDVLQAFDAFIAATPADRPIVLAGHSQGALHLRRLLAERVAGQPLARRIAAAYLVGWPLSAEHDLPRMGLPACTAPDQSGCVISWMSFGEPADPASLLGAFHNAKGLDGAPLHGSVPLCSNPLTGGTGGSAPAAANRGTLRADKDLASGKISVGFTGATCRADGILSLGPAPEIGDYVMPGNNFHVYDIPLFWQNLRQDFARRIEAWITRR